MLGPQHERLHYIKVFFFLMESSANFPTGKKAYRQLQVGLNNIYWKFENQTITMKRKY